MQRFLTGVALLLATTAAAATANLKVTLEAPPSTRPGELFVARATVENLGPDSARSTRFGFSAGAVTCFSDADLGTLEPGAKRSFECAAPIPNSGPMFYNVSAGASASSPDDVDQSDNGSSVTVPIYSTGPDLRIVGSGGEPAPALPFPFYLSVSNASHVKATNVRVIVDSPYGFWQPPPSCTVNGTRAVCSIGELTPVNTAGAQRSLTLHPFAADVGQTPFDIRIEVISAEPDNWLEDNQRVVRITTNRTVFVTSTADSGSGSLRDAIEKANRIDTRFQGVIAFRLGAPADRWHTIRLESPLPPLLTNVAIDGETQIIYFGDTNPDGPEVEIDGSAVPASNGLEIYSPCRGSVRGLAINGFTGAAIISGHRGTCSGYGLISNLIEANHLGVDPTGRRPRPNERGIVLEGNTEVRSNVISGNRRAGIFAARGRSVIAGNIIGLSPKSDGVISNGASGIYVGAEASGTTIDGNTIAFNGEWGIAIARGATGVSISPNILHSNRHLGVDWGMDGPSPNFPFEGPEITSVTFANGKTTIEGRLAPHPTLINFSNIYANDVPDPSGYGEGQYWIGNTDGDAAGNFRVTYNGDLRGKWVAGAATYFNPTSTPFVATTTEFGRSVEVK